MSVQYASDVRNGYSKSAPDGWSDRDWHVSACADTGTSHGLPGRLYIVQCEWCPQAFAAHTKKKAMEMFRIHERDAQTPESGGSVL